MGLHCGTSHITIIFIILVPINICCTFVMAIVAAVIIGGSAILIERGVW
jgi:hypothetical protein